MFTKRIDVIVPEGISQILIENSWPKREAYEPLTWRALGVESSWNLLLPDQTIPVLHGQQIEIASVLLTSQGINSNSFRKVHIWPIVRRQLSEARDRIAPVLRRVCIYKRVSRHF
jgi:hypothetical protein